MIHVKPILQTEKGFRKVLQCIKCNSIMAYPQYTTSDVCPGCGSSNFIHTAAKWIPDKQKFNLFRLETWFQKETGKWELKEK
jgi:rRNA maturation endonuclease Nob1